MPAIQPLWAVHISDGILSEWWWLTGFAIAVLLLIWGSRHVRDEEIPRIAILTAAFFVSSLIHVRIGPTSAHLLFSALVGIILGRRAVLAIAVGLTLQALLMQHGGFTALGVNCCVMTLPALAASAIYQPLRRMTTSVRLPGFPPSPLGGEGSSRWQSTHRVCGLSLAHVADLQRRAAGQ